MMDNKGLLRLSLGRGLLLAAVGATGLATAASVRATELNVTIENLAPQNGNFLTPVWVGFHNGDFDLFDVGSPAPVELERLAEDGNAAPLAAAFLASGDGLVQGTIGPAIAPGDSVSMTFDIDEDASTSRFFSYASMVIPSNDAFIANDDPTEHEVFDASGEFIGLDFIVSGDEVKDAGTEVNTEAPSDTAFFGQATPNTGPDENGVVSPHAGFNAVGSGGILDDPMFANADFTADDYRVARITVAEAEEQRPSVTGVPEPATLALFAAALAGVGWRRRRARSPH